MRASMPNRCEHCDPDDSAARPGYTLGVFDGDNLEERIRRLVARPAANLKRARLLLTTGLAAMAICVVVASSLPSRLALRCRQRYDPKAQTAYKRGDYKSGRKELQSAVRWIPPI